jgi:hypothetical protein
VLEVRVWQMLRPARWAAEPYLIDLVAQTMVASALMLLVMLSLQVLELVDQLRAAGVALAIVRILPAVFHGLIRGRVAVGDNSPAQGLVDSKVVHGERPARVGETKGRRSDGRGSKRGKGVLCGLSCILS